MEGARSRRASLLDALACSTMSDALNDLFREMMSSQLLTVVPKLAERLGDSHDNVRNAARQALLSSLDTLGASEFFRLLLPSLNSRKPLVREGVRTRFSSYMMMILLLLVEWGELYIYFKINFRK